MHRARIFCLVLFLLSTVAASFAQIDETTRQLSHDIFKELIEINTTDSVGNVTAASEATAKRLREYVYGAGNLRDPADAYKAFRGRLPTVDALLKKRGLADANPA